MDKCGIGTTSSRSTQCSTGTRTASGSKILRSPVGRPGKDGGKGACSRRSPPDCSKSMPLTSSAPGFRPFRRCCAPQRLFPQPQRFRQNQHPLIAWVGRHDLRGCQKVLETCVRRSGELTERDRADRVFDRVVVDRSTAVVEIAQQRGPAAECVVHRLGKAAVLQCLEALRLQPVLQLSQPRGGVLLAVGAQRLAL